MAAKTYIGTKIVKAEPATFGDFYGTRDFDRKGYRVTYEDGYVSWSPKDTFERCYREIGDAEARLINQR